MQFSRGEAFDLLKAWVLVTAAFLIFGRYPLSLASFLLVGIAVGGAVIFHELGHKYVAERYGYNARFISNDVMLGLGVLMAFIGFIFIAPGAVHIAGLNDNKKNAFIAWAGPAVNAALALTAYVLLGVTTATDYFHLILWVNALLGAFNLIPVPGFDGHKLWHGDKRLYAATVVILGLLVAASYTAAP